MEASVAMTVEVSPPADPLRVLVSRMARGEEEDLERLYDASRRSVYGLALRILRDPHVAEEAVVDVYAQAWRQASRFEPRKGAVAAWLLTLARTRAIDLLRSRARRRERDLVEAAPIPDGGPSPLDASGQAERARRVRSALLSLPSEQRRAIEAAFFGALSHTEVARALGAPLGTVKTRIRNGLQTLRRALASAEEGSA